MACPGVSGPKPTQKSTFFKMGVSPGGGGVSDILIFSYIRMLGSFLFFFFFFWGGGGGGG